ncbi:exodeoxyribonuclease VII small subunit [Anaerostipes sp.]|uniref:exodeoxyribonuclease VII small subunit n=1 Tax=Anaerostipes sp. TaxID=1872530 RepID=UPI0025B8F497|nr:exodeoxyribonuclease VII small subunit [Anaerostipes sp.]MBS7008011.1 exodeoxyribonuclease VII small subunit [Anaerostipes sp.]
MAKKKFQIDEGFSQLDEIIKQLEQEDVKLSDAVDLYTKGVEVLKECRDSLDQVEKELIILEQDGEQNG